MKKWSLDHIKTVHLKTYAVRTFSIMTYLKVINVADTFAMRLSYGVLFSFFFTYFRMQDIGCYLIYIEISGVNT